MDKIQVGDTVLVEMHMKIMSIRANSMTGVNELQGDVWVAKDCSTVVVGVPEVCARKQDISKEFAGIGEDAEYD